MSNVPMTRPQEVLATHEQSYGHSVCWTPLEGGRVLLSGGGEFRASDDGGLTWESRSCDEPVGSIALADCDETGCDTVYIGSGENAIRRDTYYGFGVLLGDISAQ